MSDVYDGWAPGSEAVTRAVGLLKVLSHPGRLQILCSLLDRELCVSDLSKMLNEAQPTVSQQLMRLRYEGLVVSRRDGKRLMYSLVRNEVAPVINALRDAFCQPAANSSRPGAAIAGGAFGSTGKA